MKLVICYYILIFSFFVSISWSDRILLNTIINTILIGIKLNILQARRRRTLRPIIELFWSGTQRLISDITQVDAKMWCSGVISASVIVKNFIFVLDELLQFLVATFCSTTVLVFLRVIRVVVGSKLVLEFTFLATWFVAEDCLFDIFVKQGVLLRLHVWVNVGTGFVIASLV